MLTLLVVVVHLNWLTVLVVGRDIHLIYSLVLSFSRLKLIRFDFTGFFARKLIEHFIRPADLLLTLFCWARRSRAMCVIIIVVTIRTLKIVVKKKGACHVSPPGRF